MTDLRTLNPRVADDELRCLVGDLDAALDLLEHKFSDNDDASANEPARLWLDEWQDLCDVIFRAADVLHELREATTTT